MLTITAISTAISSIIFFISGLYTFSRWKKNKNLLLKVFTIFLLSVGFQQLSFFLGSGLFVGDVIASNSFWWLAHLFMFAGVGYLFRIPVRVKFPKYEKTILNIVGVYSVIGSLILFFNIPNIEQIFISENLFNWGVPPMAGAVIGIFTTIIALSSIYIFAREGFSYKNKVLKYRSFLLALGIFIYFTGGPIHNFIDSPFMLFLAGSLLILGAIVMITGLFLPKIFKDKERG